MMSEILGYRGKRVIVTGCFSGMGEAAAKLLIELGAEVHGFDYKPCALPLASFTQVDLRDAGSIEAGVAGISGGIDALFNCAGLPNGSFDPMDVMKVNFIGLRLMTELVAERMSEGGAIASIASTGGLGWSRRIPTGMGFVTTKGWQGAMDWCAANMATVAEGYSFSKEAVIVWTQYMGAHLIKRGIRINCTLPSPTQTPMMADFEKNSGKDVIEAATQPMGRYSTPYEQAAPLVWLNSAFATIVNGVVLPVDGGFMGGIPTGQVDLSRMMRRQPA